VPVVFLRIELNVNRPSKFHPDRNPGNFRNENTQHFSEPPATLPSPVTAIRTGAVLPGKRVALFQTGTFQSGRGMPKRSHKALILPALTGPPSKSYNVIPCCLSHFIIHQPDAVIQDKLQ
jgi:hypothetical protein